MGYPGNELPYDWKSMKCEYCDSENFRKCETNISRSGDTRIRYRCKQCGRSQTVTQDAPKSKGARYLVTQCQNDTPINSRFFRSLIKFSEENSCKLLVFRTTLLTPHNLSVDPEWDIPIDYLYDGCLELADAVKVLSGIKVSVTQTNPLAGIDDLSRGKHIIVAHPQLQMKTLLTDKVECPIFAYQTGSVSVPNYSHTKSGLKAKQNHSYSAIYVDISDVTHLRVINGDENGDIYDISGVYTPEKKSPLTHIEALITGDEHAVFMSEHVKSATYTNADQMVNVLKPKLIVRHDVLDFYSSSHHHEQNFLLKYTKRKNNTDDVKAELDKTCAHIIDTTPTWQKNVIVSSNHNDHLDKWLSLYDPKLDITNAKVYFGIMYTMLDNIDKGIPTTAFESYFKTFFKDYCIEFAKRDEEYLIGGIDVSYHGDRGGNGTRGSAAQFARAKHNLVIGHSHSPKIEKGVFQVGTSTSRLEYSVGLTSWANTHCIIHQNGTRQLLTILEGKWR